jgi:hypothetical protein
MQWVPRISEDATGTQTTGGDDPHLRSKYTGHSLLFWRGTMVYLDLDDL